MATINDPIRIGNLEMRNRTALLPMGMEVDNYYMSDKLVDLYAQMSEGGLGLLTVGGVAVCDNFNVVHQYPAGSHGIGAWQDDFIPGLKRLTDAIRAGGALSCAQLDIHYEWRADGSQPFEAVGPSDGPGGPFVKHLRELTVDEIHQIVEQYGDACRRCKEAGFDMVEIHAGIGYLLSRFLSPFANKRTDEYGGSLENRARIIIEIMDNCHAKCGDDYPLMVRYNGEDYMPNGLTMADAIKLVPIFEKAGSVALSIQAGFHECPRPLVNQFVPDGVLVDMASIIKQHASVPVIAGYRIARPELARSIISEGKADIVGMGRANLADPAFVKKMLSGHDEDIRPCICCCRCLDSTFVGRELTCSMNADIASDLGLPERKPTEKKKKVVVVGAGPAGMEAARVAAIRGHNVILIDKNKHVGGLTNMAAVLNAQLERVPVWYEAQLKKLGVDVRMNEEISADAIMALGADEIIVAPGGDVIIPDIPGMDNKNVFGSFELKSMLAGHAPKKGIMWSGAAFAMRFLGNNKPFMRWGMGLPWPVKKNVVVIGGGFAGGEVAEAMMKGRNITIIEEGPRILEDLGPVTKGTETELLKKGGVKVLTKHKAVEITPKGVKAKNLETDEIVFIPAGTVMPSLGVDRNEALYDELKKRTENVSLVGDAVGAQTAPAPKEGERPTPKWELGRRIREAVRDGYTAAMNI